MRIDAGGSGTYGPMPLPGKLRYDMILYSKLTLGHPRHAVHTIHHDIVPKRPFISCFIFIFGASSSAYSSRIQSFNTGHHDEVGGYIVWRQGSEIFIHLATNINNMRKKKKVGDDFY